MFSDEKGWPEIGDIIKYEEGNGYLRVVLLLTLLASEASFGRTASRKYKVFDLSTLDKQTFYIWADKPEWTLVARAENV